MAQKPAVAFFVFLFAALALAAGVPRAAFADVLTFKNGNVLECLVVSESDREITVDVGGGQVTFSRSDISRVDRKSASENKGLIQSQNDYLKRFKKQSIYHPEFAPAEGKSLAEQFMSICRERRAAIEYLALIDRHEREKSQFTSKTLELHAKIQTLSREAQSVDRQAEPERFTKIVTEINLAISENELLKQKLATLTAKTKQLSAEINQYAQHVFAYKILFQNEFSRRKKDPDKLLGGNLQDFFKTLQSKLNRVLKELPKITSSSTQKGAPAVVNAYINDTVMARLVVDTGASMVTLYAATAKSLNFDVSSGFNTQVILANGQTVPAKSVMLKSIRVGDVSAQDIPAIILSKASETAEDGLLGMSFLSRFIMQYDPQSSTFILRAFKPDPSENI